MASPPSASPVIDPELPAPLSMGAVLRIAMMRRLWYAQTISVFGDFLALFAVISVLTFRLHANAQQVTGLQIAYLLPIALLGVLAGVFVDRWPLKPTMVGSDVTRAGLVLLLFVANQLWQFYAILAAISVVSSFFSPAQGVAIRSAVPLHGLRSANALIQQVMFGMRILGPAAAAFLVASFGPKSCYLADSASFVGSALLILSVPFVQAINANAPVAPSPSTSSAIGRVWQDAKQGLSFIFHHAGLLFVTMALASGMFVLGCFGPLIAVYVREDLHAATRIFGIASALIGVGMLVGTNLVGTFAKRLKDEFLVFLGLGGIALGLVFLSVFALIWTTFLGDFLIGFAVAGIVIPAQTMMQQETPPAMMGRIGSAFMSLIFTAQIAGLVLSGFLAKEFGIRHVFGLCAIVLALLIVAGYVWKKQAAQPVATAGQTSA
ncbi:MAG TPA: MFS transporter [Chthoniobacterales bacterium]|jgi:MFS family permease